MLFGFTTEIVRVYGLVYGFVKHTLVYKSFSNKHKHKKKPIVFFTKPFSSRATSFVSPAGGAYTSCNTQKKPKDFFCVLSRVCLLDE